MPRKKRINLQQLKTIPIVDVARALGMVLKHTGSGMWNEKSLNDPIGYTSLSISEKSNRWKRWSGKGEPNQGSVIDLVMATKGYNFQEAIEYLTSTFPQFP